jgi:hypothetical protein
MADDSCIPRTLLPEPSRKPSQQSAVQIARDLRHIAGACKVAADLNTAEPADEELVGVGGWTIVDADREGLLTSIVDLRQIVAPEDQMILQRTTPKRLQHRLPPAKTLDDLLREYRSRFGMFGKPNLTKSAKGKQRSPSVKGDDADINSAIDQLTSWMKQNNIEQEILPALGNIAARRVVERLWEFLAPTHIDQLTPAASRIFFHQTTIVERQQAQRTPGLVKAEWVCRFLSEAINNEYDTSSPANWMRLKDAEDRIGRPAGTISNACKRGEIADNGKKGRKRRIDPASLDAYARKLKERDDLHLFKAEELEKQKKKEAQGALARKRQK